LIDDWVEQFDHEGSMAKRQNVVIQHAPCAENANAYEMYNKTHTIAFKSPNIFLLGYLLHHREKVL